MELIHRYQFNPQMSNPDVIVNILLKSLSSTVQGPDFNLCLSLLREPSVSGRTIELSRTDSNMPGVKRDSC